VNRFDHEPTFCFRQAYQPIPSKMLSPSGDQKTMTQASEESQRTVQEYADAMRTAKEELTQDLVGVS